ncbi:hypothetical protein DQ384_15660 [Sphaerisporangium album]|uniref:Uncharacterized protein n=1 Tax=Sphaerisporangium album TaxID=509200 RepID=A0A367FIN5_9ACTN|nr:hypothetical protein DQ384_15660 [Sphaerisporangium album]
MPAVDPLAEPLAAAAGDAGHRGRGRRGLRDGGHGGVALRDGGRGGVALRDGGRRGGRQGEGGEGGRGQDRRTCGHPGHEGPFIAGC